MAKLTDDIKHQIVIQLAQFRGYAEVSRLIQEETGVKVDRFQVRTYDPTNMAYAGSDKWRAIFDAARHAYLHSVENVPVANKAYRLNELQRNYADARAKGNLALANATLEQAAKEVTPSASERNGLVPTPSPFAAMTPEERRAVVTEMLRAALDAKRNADNPASALGYADKLIPS